MPAIPDYETIYGQTEDALTVTLTKLGVGRSLSGSSVVANLRSFATGNVTQIVMTPDADQATNPGLATYDWAGGYPPDGPGPYDVQYAVTDGDGDVEYFPNKAEYFLFVLRPAIG